MSATDAIMNTVEWVELEGEPPDDGDGLPWATHMGVLKIGDVELKCYQLSNGHRIFDADSVMEFFGFGPNPLHVDKDGNG